VSGPHAKKLTVPVGLPPPLVPVIVAASTFWAPNVTDPLCGADVVVDES
jgi:hypothetical protein